MVSCPISEILVGNVRSRKKRTNWGVQTDPGHAKINLSDFRKKSGNLARFQKNRQLVKEKKIRTWCQEKCETIVSNEMTPEMSNNVWNRVKENDKQYHNLMNENVW